MAVKLFGEIARSQASTRHPVAIGHILRRLVYSLIDISQIAIQKVKVTFEDFRKL